MYIRSILSMFTIVAFATVPAHAADIITFNLSAPVQSGDAGSVLSYYGTIAAPITNSGIKYLNGDAENIASTTIAIDDDGFFNNGPLFLDPGQSYTGLFFTALAASGTSVGSYEGSFSIIGGPNDESQDVLATQLFDVTVLPAVIAPVPEPASWVMMILGLGAVGFAMRRRLGVNTSAYYAI